VLLLLLLWQLRFFAAAAARPDPTPTPFLGGREVPKKTREVPKKQISPVASALAVVHVGVHVDVMKVAVQCNHYTSEI
jgi:hypothetical protein